ncbi:MAG: class I SAM-dependent methyltransferase [Phycisphaerales bacterium]|nr:class I SAM-dependent methyltransferase [Phycisphaerales bacterium]
MSTRPLDKHDLYELSAQSPERDARLIRAILDDGRRTSKPAAVLGEDFCGTAALSEAWCQLNPKGRAIAVDVDPKVLAAARARGREHDRLELVRGDASKQKSAVDAIAVLNFSICEWHTRPQLVRYFKAARARLKAGGMIVCDLYGGSDAYTAGMIDQTLRLPKPPMPPHPLAGMVQGLRVLYSWEQRSADPLTGRVVNAMHFDAQPVKKGEAKPLVIIDAFVYDWRLWSVPELREAMTEAGFKSTAVYPRMPDATDSDGRVYVQPIDDPGDAAAIADGYNVFVVGRR